jgi:hypothetical protein
MIQTWKASKLKVPALFVWIWMSFNTPLVMLALPAMGYVYKVHAVPTAGERTKPVDC